MKNGKLYFLLLTSLLTAGLSGCSDEDKPREDDPLVLPANRMFVLNEGSMNGNNASVTFYDPSGSIAPIGDLYEKQNGKKLGELAQHILAYESELFLTVSGSKVICRLGDDGKEKGRLSMEQYGNPRFLAAKDGKLYVTVYGTPGRVFRLNAETLAIEESVEVGNNPENIVCSGSKLYISDAAYGEGNTVSVIDIPSFKVVETVAVGQNPNDLLANGSAVYVISWGENWEAFDLQRIDTSSYAVKTIGKANKMAVYRDKLYLTYSTTDWGAGLTTTDFFTYDPAADQIDNRTFLSDGAFLSDKTIYMLDIHPETGRIYVGTTDYQTNGPVYVFTAEGVLKDQFTSGGINPNKAVFIDR